MIHFDNMYIQKIKWILDMNNIKTDVTFLNFHAITVHFVLPTITQLQDIKIGDFVKISFQKGERPIESMWICVDSILDGFDYTGRLDNYPIEYTEYTLGDRFAFNAKNIKDILKDN